MFPPASCLVCADPIDPGTERIIVTTALSGRGATHALPLRIASLHAKCWAQVHAALLKLREAK